MAKFVIYTALVGGYDNVMQPDVVNEHFDYVLFTNDIKEHTVGVWQVHPIPYANSDNTRICRYVKTHPEELLSGYDASIWVDSNVRILTDMIYQRAIELHNQGIQVASMWHPCRKCLYEEAFAVVNMMMEHEDVVIRWCHQLRKECFPKNLGLFETGILFRSYTRGVAAVDALWWWCIDNYSRRDQLSFTYALWKCGIPFVYFLDEGRNVRNTKHFSLVVHNKPYQNHCPIVNNEAWLMRYCWKDKSSTDDIESLYYKLYRFPFPRFVFALMGQVYRIKYLIKHR